MLRCSDRSAWVLAATAPFLLALFVVGAGWHGALNYDGAYGLVWGADVAQLRRPEVAAPFAPTPKPFAIVAGVLAEALSLGEPAASAMVLLGVLSLGVLGVVCGVLAGVLAGRAAAVLAGVVVVTREPVVSWALRGYLDVLYAALIVAAVLALVVYGRRSMLPCLLLAVGGTIRPEAWVLAALSAWWAWGGRGRGGRATLVVAVVLPAAGWMAFDVLATGSPFWSLTGTQQGTERLGRATGLDALVLVAPRRLGEVLREPVLLAAAVGVVVVAARRGPRERVVLGALLLLSCLFAGLAVLGLPVIARYLLPIAALLGVVGAIGVVRGLAAGRSLWVRAPAALAAVLLVAMAPKQLDRLRDTGRVLGKQRAITAELRSLLDDERCLPVALPNHRLAPDVQRWAGVRSGALRAGDPHLPRRGTIVVPGPDARRLMVLDRADEPVRLAVGSGGDLRRGRWWTVVRRCGGSAR